MEVFTDEWAKTWQVELNKSEQYRTSATTWEWPLALKMQRDPSVGVSEDRAILLDLYHGQCRDARIASPEDLGSATYVISADPYTWKQIFERKLEPISSIMRGKLALEKGNMSTLSQYVMAAKHLVECALSAGGEMPEGLK